MIKYAILTLSLIFVFSCKPSSPLLNDPRVEIHSGLNDYDSDIDRLEFSKANLNTWIKHSLESKKIKSMNHALSVLGGIELSDSDLAVIKMCLSQGSVWHFGFDRNFHAVVTFDQDGQQLSVIKW